jgi:hypothetical protein
MGTRVFFIAIALALVVAGFWAYRHDEGLRKNSALVTLGDANEVVRESQQRRPVWLVDAGTRDVRE